MNQIETNEYWKDILEKFSKYEGTISGFCREYDVNIHRLYYQRKKLRKKNESIFHAINLTKLAEIEATTIKVFEKNIYLYHPSYNGRLYRLSTYGNSLEEILSNKKE